MFCPDVHPQPAGFLFPSMLFFCPDVDSFRKGVKGKDIWALICFLNPLVVLHTHTKKTCLTFGQRIVHISSQLDHHPFQAHQPELSVSRSHRSLLSLHN